MLRIYGRPDSSAVARVMWTVEELGLDYERVDWGGAYGGNDSLEYRAMNPSGKIPTVRLENGQALWESNAIIRYLCAIDPTHKYLPIDPFERAKTEAWMDWAGALQNAVSRIRKAYKPAGATQSDISSELEQVAPTLRVLNTQLAGQNFVMGHDISVADFALGVWAHRLWRCPPVAKPRGLDAIWKWLERLQARPAYREHVMEKVSAGPQHVGGG
ncbi:MAG: glutathione S-transferase family protein [Pseudomonadota bacterium]